MKLSPARLALPAALLSVIVPGTGHFLIRAWARGAIWLAGWFLLSAMSGVAHSPVVLVLMLVAALDAYLMARSLPDPSGPAIEDGSGEGERQ